MRDHGVSAQTAISNHVVHGKLDADALADGMIVVGGDQRQRARAAGTAT
jgi:hypothetical protein